MDPRERHNDHEEALQAMLDGRQATIWTCLPGTIETVDLGKMTCTVQPTLQGQIQDQQGNWKSVNLPLLVDCPLVFPRGGGFTLTFPVKKGNECLIFFSCRNIDAWWQNGGVQPQDRFRMHDLSDGFVMVGPTSQPNVIASISDSTVQLRNDAGDTYVEVAGGQVVNVVAPGGINLNGVMIDSDGNMSGIGTLDASGEGTFNGHTVGEHTHGGVTAGSDNTGTPTG